MDEAVALSLSNEEDALSKNPNRKMKLITNLGGALLFQKKKTGSKCWICKLKEQHFEFLFIYLFFNPSR